MRSSRQLGKTTSSFSGFPRAVSPAARELADRRSGRREGETAGERVGGVGEALVLPGARHSITILLHILALPAHAGAILLAAPFRLDVLFVPLVVGGFEFLQFLR